MQDTQAESAARPAQSDQGPASERPTKCDYTSTILTGNHRPASQRRLHVQWRFIKKLSGQVLQTARCAPSLSGSDLLVAVFVQCAPIAHVVEIREVFEAGVAKASRKMTCTRGLHESARAETLQAARMEYTHDLCVVHSSPMIGAQLLHCRFDIHLNLWTSTASKAPPSFS